MRSKALSEVAPAFLASTSPCPLHATHQQPCPSFWFSGEPACLQAFADALPSAQNMPSPVPFAWLTHTDSSLSPPRLCLMREVRFACKPMPSVTTLSYQLTYYLVIVFSFTLSPVLEWELLEDEDFGLVTATPQGLA